MVFLSRFVYHAVFSPRPDGAPRGAPESSFCTVLRAGSTVR
jgi:hypothetical protein